MRDYHLGEVDAHMLMAGGVYAILNEENEYVYVGQTHCFAVRWGQLCDKTQHHHPVPLIEIFRVVILEYEESKEKREQSEKEYINALNPKYNNPSALKHPYNPFDSKTDIYKKRKLNKEHPNRPQILHDYNESFDNPDDELQYLLSHRHQPD